MAIPPAYDQGGNFSCGLAPVKVGALWGFIDPAGRMAMEPAFEEMTCVHQTSEDVGFSEALCAVKRDGNWIFIDPHGKVEIPDPFESVTDFRNGIAGVRIDGRCWFMDPRGVRVETKIVPSLSPPPPPPPGH